MVKYSGEAFSNPKAFGFIDKGQIKLEVNFDSKYFIYLGNVAY